jgi:hypothetical protein
MEVGEKCPNNLAYNLRLPRYIIGLTCRKSATWSKPKGGMLRFFRPKNPRSWLLETTMLTTRPPKSLWNRLTVSRTVLTTCTTCYNIKHFKAQLLQRAPPGFNTKHSTFCPQNVWPRVNIFLRSVNLLVFMTETKCVESKYVSGSTGSVRQGPGSIPASPTAIGHSGTGTCYSPVLRFSPW